MKESSNVLSTQSTFKLFIKYCIPAVISMLIAGLQGMIDGMFVGNYIGSDALASVNFALPFMQIIFGLSMIVSIGTQSYAGYQLGKGDIEKAQNGFHTFKIIIIIGALFITVFGVGFSEWIAVLLGAKESLIHYTAVYVQVISFFSIFICIMLYFGFLNRIVGKPEMYFYGSILSILTNIGLDYLFLVHLDMGVNGAAIATGMSYIVALLVVIWPMLDRKNAINIFVGKFSKECIKPILFNGASEGINSMSIAITAYLFNVSLMRIAGADGVAAFTAINYIGGLGVMVLFGISDGVGPIVSFNYGMNDSKRVKDTMNFAYLSNLLFGVLLFLLLYFNGEFLAGLFIKDQPTLIDMASAGGKLYGISFLFAGFNILNSGYFTFIGKGLESVIVASCRGFIFVSIGIFVLPLFLELNGIWLSVAFAEVCAVFVGIILLNKKRETNSVVASYDKSMDKESVYETKYNQIITINRTFSSGGREVAKRLSDALKCAYYDREIVNEIQDKLHIKADVIEHLKEFDMKKYPYAFSRSFMQYEHLPIGEIQHIENEVIVKLAKTTKGVFVGRCCNVILSDLNPLKVFIYNSNMDSRIDRCLKKEKTSESIDPEKIRREIIKIDEKRSKYYTKNTNQSWKDLNQYHLCIDTSKTTPKHAVELILIALNKKS